MSLQRKEPHPLFQALALCGLVAAVLWVPMAFHTTQPGLTGQTKSEGW